MIWYRLNIGRERNADPKWLIPLICNAGGVSKAEIGSIKINDRDTRFQIVADFAEQFDLAVRTNKQKEGHIARVGAHSAADDATVAKAIDAIGKPNPSPSSEKPSKPHGKAPWHDRSKGKPTAHKGDGHKAANKPLGLPGAPKPKSKFDFKKKHRKGPPSGA